MKWVTRADVKVGRMACSWLIYRFVDPEAEIQYVPRDQVQLLVEDEQAMPFHVPRTELAHQGTVTSFEAILAKYGLAEDPALALMGQIINGADTDNRRFQQAEGPGVRAVTEGIRLMSADDKERVAMAIPVFDAIYAYCAEQVRVSPKVTRPESSEIGM